MEAPLSGVLRGFADGFTHHSAMAESLKAGKGTEALEEGTKVLLKAKHVEQLSVLCVEEKSRFSHGMSMCVRVQLRLHFAWGGSSILYCGGILQFPVLFLGLLYFFCIGVWTFPLISTYTCLTTARKDILI